MIGWVLGAQGGAGLRELVGELASPRASSTAALPTPPQPRPCTCHSLSFSYPRGQQPLPGTGKDTHWTQPLQSNISGGKEGAWSGWLLPGRVFFKDSQGSKIPVRQGSSRSPGWLGLEGLWQSIKVCTLPRISQVGSLRPRKGLAGITQLVRGRLGSPGSHTSML